MADERDTLIAPMNRLEFPTSDEGLRQRLRAAGCKLHERLGEPTFAARVCPECGDHGYTFVDRTGPKGSFRERYTASLRCETCPRGIAIEAGHWFALLNPGKRKPAPAPATTHAYARRLRAHPNGLLLRQAFDALGKKPTDTAQEGP